MDDLIAKYPEVIAQMEEVFDSHTFILNLAEHNQSAYVRALAVYPDDHCFQKLHAQLSLAIGETKLVEKIGTHTSENIWRKPNACAVWRKIAKPA